MEDAGADWSRPDTDDWLPLHLAAYHGHLSIVEYLVGLGADVNKSTDEGMTSLHMASSKGFTDIVRYLILIQFKHT